MDFNDFNKWKSSAKTFGATVRKVTVTKRNTYYQAIIGGRITGFFNVNVNAAKSGGKLEVLLTIDEAKRLREAKRAMINGGGLG